jgi:hypothetical protein
MNNPFDFDEKSTTFINGYSSNGFFLFYLINENIREFKNKSYLNPRIILPMYSIIHASSEPLCDSDSEKKWFCELKIHLIGSHYY